MLCFSCGVLVCLPFYQEWRPRVTQPEAFLHEDFMKTLPLFPIGSSFVSRLVCFPGRPCGARGPVRVPGALTPAKTLLAAMLIHKTYAAAAMRFLATLRGSGVAEYFFEFVNFVSRDLRSNLGTALCWRCLRACP